MHDRLLTIHNTYSDDEQIMQHQGSARTNHIDVAISALARVDRVKWSIILRVQNRSFAFATDINSVLMDIASETCATNQQMCDQQSDTMRCSDHTIARAWTFVAQRTSLIWCVCVLQHTECKITASRRGWITINTKGKKTSLNNFGCRNVSTCTESSAAHTSQSIKTALVQHTIAPTQSYKEFTQSVFVCVCYNIENVKEKHQGEAERQSIQR